MRLHVEAKRYLCSSSARAEEFAGMAAAMRDAVNAARLPVRLVNAMAP